MANSSVESVGDTQNMAETSQSPAAARPVPEQPLKLKGRARLAAGLQRISSSQSLAKLGRTRARTYSGTGRGSVSCISLNSASSSYVASLGAPLTSDQSNGYSTAPTSAVTTPSTQIPSFGERTRTRTLSNLDGKTSAAVPSNLATAAKTTGTPGIAEVDEDYFSRPVARPSTPPRKVNFWLDMPSEVKMQILTYLEPREIVRSSRVSKDWHRMCFDGQLWSIMDTAGFYQDISADALVSIITKAGPFVRDLNLRGCVQLRERWHSRGLSDACRNLENFSLEGCRIDRTSIHSFLYANSRLVHVNLSGLAGATNSAMRIIAGNCPKLEYLNISWCNNINTSGLRKVIQACAGLKDIRAGEVSGWDDVEFMQELFERNNLERLILMNCDSLTDESLSVLMEGKESEIDYLTGRPIVPPRKFKHLDLTRCRGITDRGLRTCVNNIPEIEGLQLSKCNGILDETLTELIPTTPMLSHLDLEELEGLSNAVLQCIANSPCATRLRHLSISYCENMGDTGMLPLVRACTNIRSLEMDNTRISDLVLAEAAAMMRLRTPRTILTDNAPFTPSTGLRLIAYDCQNVTWTGVREVLSRNAEVITTTKAAELPPLEKNTTSSTPTTNPSSPSTSSENISASRSGTPRIHVIREHAYPSQIIQLKCFYTFQPTVEEHTKRVMRGDFASARRLERKWAEFMIAQEEAGAQGAGSRRRRRRAREAQMMHADEEGGSPGAGTGVGGGRRRRARSGGCAVM